MQNWEWVVAEISVPAVLLQGAGVIAQNTAAGRCCSSLGCAVDVLAREAQGAFESISLDDTDAFNAWESTTWHAAKHAYCVRRRRLSPESDMVLLLVEPLSVATEPRELRVVAPACVSGVRSLRPLRDAEQAQRKRAESIARVGSYRLQMEAGQFYATGFLHRRLQQARIKAYVTFENLLSVFSDVEAKKILGVHEVLLQGAATASTEVTLIDANGGTMTLELRCECDRNGQGEAQCIYGAFIDVTQRVLGEQAVRFMAYHDALTGLPNRAMFMQHSAQLLEEAKAGGESFALHLIDLDGFKALNDNHGHLAGDRALQVVAERLVANVRSSDMCFRLGGDEFAILLRGVHAVGSVEGLGQRLAQSLSEPFMLGTVQVSIGASLGGALYVEGEDVQHMMLRSDEMLYAVKRSGKGSFKLAA